MEATTNLLKGMLDHAQIKKSELSRRTGVSRSTIDRLIADPLTANLGQLEKLAAACGGTISTAFVPNYHQVISLAAQIRARFEPGFKPAMDHDADPTGRQLVSALRRHQARLNPRNLKDTVSFVGNTNMYEIASAPDYVEVEWMFSGLPVAGYDGPLVLWVDCADNEYRTIVRALTEDLKPTMQDSATLILARAPSLLFQNTARYPDESGKLVFSSTIQTAIDAVGVDSGQIEELLKEVLTW